MSAARRSLRREHKVLIVAALIAFAAVAFAVVRVNDHGSTPKPGDLAGDPGVSHVHGLGIDPADGTLYVATHYGTFRIPTQGPAQRVGASYQDTMGFTGAGAHDFLGSGHPDLAGARAGQPRLLGLIESRDGGVTWASLSLPGGADFHALAYAHDTVYGWDVSTGRFMVSTNRTTWDIRSTVDLESFAVDPSAADHIIATTSGGMLESSDGGRAWSKLTAPALAVVSWDATAGLWGADPSGVVSHSSDSGRTWTTAGTLPGEPQAILATPSGLYAAASHDRTGIYRSTDAGKTWQLRYQDPQ